MKEYLNKVKEFQLAFDQEVNNEPTILLPEESRLRFDLAEEELIEYEEATEEEDLVETLDSLVDQMYILLGTINAHGMQDIFEEAFNRVHENNLSKLVDGKPLKNEAGKVIKPKGFKPVILNDLV
jgi:predicted HAD superfamily Cof-like phosphohydrolase